MAMNPAETIGAINAERELKAAQEACAWLQQCPFMGEFGAHESKIAHRALRQLRRRIAAAQERDAKEAVAG